MMEVPVLLKLFVLLAALTATLATDQDGFSLGGQPDIAQGIKRGVIYELYTRENGEDPEILNLADMAQNIRPKSFDPKIPVRFCVHGWQTNGVSISYVRKGFIDKGKHNVILMNWTRVDNVIFPVARKKVTALGQWLSYLIDLLVDLYHLDTKDFHIVGHSMGAHISGMAGRTQISDRNRRIGRITGLDPAGPLFKDALDKLTYEAALFVDVIHTCGNILGLWEPVGHADFYPNGGKCIQKGCYLQPDPSCSHNRATYFFAESLTSKVGFWSWPFVGGPEGNFETNSEWVLMGDPIDTRTRGVYYVETAKCPPFAIPPLSNLADNFATYYYKDNPAFDGCNVDLYAEEANKTDLI